MEVTMEVADAPDAGAAQTRARTRLPDRLLIPDVRIRVSAAANTKQLEKRFNYLWQSAHSILPTNALLAHQMMYEGSLSSMLTCIALLRMCYASAVLICVTLLLICIHASCYCSSSMMEMARTNRVELSAAVLDFICECCGALIVPSLSADVRVQPQTPKSRANRKLTRERHKLAVQTGTPGVPQLLLNILVGFIYFMDSLCDCNKRDVIKLTPECCCVY